jgi:hypothetical protein
MDVAEEVRIQQEITANEFFHDFLLFLHEAARQPFRLTEKGNLRLGDIHYFGEHFHQDSDFRWPLKCFNFNTLCFWLS